MIIGAADFLSPESLHVRGFSAAGKPHHRGINLPLVPSCYPVGMKLCNTWVLSCQHQLQILARRGADRSVRGDAARLLLSSVEVLLKLTSGFLFAALMDSPQKPPEIYLFIYFMDTSARGPCCSAQCDLQDNNVWFGSFVT